MTRDTVVTLEMCILINAHPGGLPLTVIYSSINIQVLSTEHTQMKARNRVSMSRLYIGCG